jgi:predicted dehydrogenase
VVGLGVGKGHIEGYIKDKRCKLVAICDVDREKLKTLKVKFDIPITTTNFDDIVKREDIDAISICTPDNLHTEQIVAGLNAGKHILAEKPIATTLKDCERITRVVEKSKKVLASNLILRYCPRFRKVKELADKGYFGNIFYAEGDYIHNIQDLIRHGWRGKMKDYNITAGGGVHLIDLLRWIINDEVEEVFCYGNNKCMGKYFKMPDCMVSVLKFRKGCVAKTLTTLACKRPQFHNLQIYGTKATFVNGYDKGEIYNGTDRTSAKNIKLPYPGVEKGVLINHFIDCIIRNKQPIVDVYEAVNTVAVCIAAMESFKIGKPVKVRYL